MITVGLCNHLQAYSHDCEVWLSGVHSIELGLQVAQLWQRNRASSIDDFKEWVHLRLNFRLKGNASPQLWFRAITTLRLLTRCLLLRSGVFFAIKYRILRHQKTSSHHIKCANSTAPT